MMTPVSTLKAFDRVQYHQEVLQNQLDSLLPEQANIYKQIKTKSESFYILWTLHTFTISATSSQLRLTVESALLSDSYI